MKKRLSNVILFVFAYNLLIFVAANYADVVNLDSTSQIFIATNSSILQNTSIPQNINELASTKITKPDAWYKSNTGLWYYFENDWTTTRTGWFVDPMDEQTY